MKNQRVTKATKHFAKKNREKKFAHTRKKSVK